MLVILLKKSNSRSKNCFAGPDSEDTMSFISESKVSKRAPGSKENEPMSTNFQLSPPETE